MVGIVPVNRLSFGLPQGERRREGISNAPGSSLQ